MTSELAVGFIQISAYGALLLLAFMVAGGVGAWLARRHGVDAITVVELLPFAAVGSAIGGKLYKIATNWDAVVRDPSIIPSLGSAFYACLFGGVAAAAWFCHRRRIPIHMLLDLGTPAVIVGIVIGRIGCFVNGDDWGKPTSLPWAVSFPNGNPPSTAGNLRALDVVVPSSVPDSQVMAVHPTQLYEALAMAIASVYLLRLAMRPHTPLSVVARGMLIYGSWRFLLEFLRAKDDRFSFGLTLMQLVSVALVFTGLWLFSHARESRAAVA